MRNLRRFAFLLLLFASSAFSQTANVSGDAQLTGTLTDPSGAGVGSVEITAKPEDRSSGMIYKATSRTDGEYSVALPAGKYHVRFVRAPFVERAFDLSFAPGETRTLDLRLELERLSAKVIVTAQAEPLPWEDSPTPATLYTRQEIERQGPVALAELFLFTPGISIGRTGPEGGQTSVFLGGGNSSFTRVLVDGTAVNEPGNAVDFSNFTFDNVDKVEVVRGAESALYGTDAVSGVIQLFSHRGTTHMPAVSVFGEGGGFSTGRGGGQVSGLVSKFDYSAAGSYFETQGRGPNDRFVNRTITGNFGWSFNEENRMRLALRNSTSNAGIPGQTLFTPPNLDQHSDLHSFSANARWEFSNSAHWNYQMSGAESYNHENNANPVQSFFATDPNAQCPQMNPAAVATAEFCDFPFVDMNQYNRAGFSAQSSYLLPKAGVTAGYQYEVENATVGFLGIGHLRRNNQGGFLDARWWPHARVTMSVGARAEANEQFGTRVVPRAGASMVLHTGAGLWGDTRARVFYGPGVKEPRFGPSF